MAIACICFLAHVMPLELSQPHLELGYKHMFILTQLCGDQPVLARHTLPLITPVHNFQLEAARA